MPRKLPPFVECGRDPHGRVRVYFRKAKGQRTALPTSIGSDELSMQLIRRLYRPGSGEAAGRRLAEAGCSANEIMSILGHKTLAEAERYTREADQAKLSSCGRAQA